MPLVRRGLKQTLRARVLELLRSAMDSGDPLTPPVARQPALTPPPAVLVVDDEEITQLLAQTCLRTWGIAATVAHDGEEAVRMAAERRFDLILMDLSMPRLDGLGATREIRRGERLHASVRVPVVAYTSMNFCDGALLVEHGIDDLLAKPCGAEDIRACLARWCPGLHGKMQPYELP